MQNTENNQLVPGELSESLRKRFETDPDGAEEELRGEFDVNGKVRTVSQGPVFREGEIVPIKGYNYRVTGIKKNRLFLKPHGPIAKEERDR